MSSRRRSKARSDSDWDVLRVHIERLAKDGASVTQLAARFSCSWQTMQNHVEKWGIEMKFKPNEALKPRNERILDLVKAGHKDAAIVRMLQMDYPDLTRGMIIGLRHRNGAVLPKAEAERSRTQASRGRALQEKINSGRFVFGDNPPASRKKAPPMEIPIEPRIMPAPIVESAPPQPQGGRWVHWEHATGCAWIEGDVKAGTAVMCNARRCQVVRAHDPAKILFRVDYCREHWIKRRAPTSKFTKVVA